MDEGCSIEVCREIERNFWKLNEAFGNLSTFSRLDFNEGFSNAIFPGRQAKSPIHSPHKFHASCLFIPLALNAR
jgi:hypothetical protein